MRGDQMRLIALTMVMSLALPLAAPAQDGASGSTAATVAAWDAGSQDWYFQVSIGMLAVVASQNDDRKARCINDWYFASAAQRSRRNEDLRELMRRFPDYRPGGVILAAVEKACGEMIFRN